MGKSIISMARNSLPEGTSTALGPLTNVLPVSEASAASTEVEQRIPHLLLGLSWKIPK